MVKRMEFCDSFQEAAGVREGDYAVLFGLQIITVPLNVPGTLEALSVLWGP